MMDNQLTQRHDWQHDEVMALLQLPFNELIFKAQSIHRQHFNANQVQLSTLMNIKTGACSENCGYCAQSAHFNTAVTPEALVPLERVLSAAQQAQQQGASRFCMSAAWRQPKAADFEHLLELIRAVKALGLETCASLGFLSAQQAHQLKAAGLDYYNHNLDTAARYYPQIVTTHSYAERLTTLAHVRAAALKVCCGGIIGMGETQTERAQLLLQLANLPQQPESVPINVLVPIAGTPLAAAQPLPSFELVRCIAGARILMPEAFVRLSAGRMQLSDELQALCFLAGANAIFYGNQLLTTANPTIHHDQELFNRLGMQMI